MNIDKEKLKKDEKDEKKPISFWKSNLNPITMWEPIKDNYLESQNKTKKYYNKTQSI